MLRLIPAALAAALLLGTPAAAGVVLNDNFNSEDGGATVLQYTSFANFTVTGTGVDLIGPSNGYGITCAGGSGSCVDLSGTPGPGGLESASYTYAAGSTILLSFDLSGNQRQPVNQGEDSYRVLLNWTGNMQAYTFDGVEVFPDLTGSTGVDFGGAPVNWNDPFSTHTVSVEALAGGTITATIYTDQSGNIGPILDNVSLSIGGVPESATWIMLLAGFFGMGAIVRNRSGARPAVV